MKFYNLLILLAFFSSKLSAQEVMAEPDERNGDSYYTVLKVANDNINDVKTLDIQKNDGDIFLTNPTYFKNLETLKIHFSKLKKIGSLNNFSNLKEIRIMYSWNLEKLPEDFTLLPKLTEIDVYSCGLKTLPETFFNNNNLTTVCICQNQLSVLPAIPVENSITFLNLNANYFNKLPSDFANLKNLETLTIKDCSFTTFPLEILKLEKLKTLDISANNIDVLPEALGEMKNLERLYLTKLKISKFPKSLKKSNLKFVQLSDTNLSDIDKKRIEKAFPKNCQIYWYSKLNYGVDVTKCDCLKQSYFE